MSAIFIISQHRTGSTLLKNMLDAHSEINMAFDEMNLFEPMRKDSLDILVGNQIKTPEDLLTAIKHKEIYGTFWKEFSRSGIAEEDLINTLNEEHEFNLQTILGVILNLLAKNFQTPHSGVKYPVHFSKAAELKEWFPASKLIFLTRNPKAIIASKLNDPATKKRKSKSILHRFVIHYLTVFYFGIEYRKSVKQWSENKHSYLKVTYEELVKFQSATLNKICEFCSVDFEEQMLQVSGKESSFTQNVANRPVTHSLEKYKSTLSNFDQRLIDRLTKSSYKKVNQ